MDDKETMTPEEFCEALAELGRGSGWSFFCEQANGDREAARRLSDHDERERWDKAVTLIRANKQQMRMTSIQRELSRDIYLRGSGWTVSGINALFADALSDTKAKLQSCVKQINDAIARREDLIRQIHQEGSTIASISKMAGLSTDRISKILKEARSDLV